MDASGAGYQTFLPHNRFVPGKRSRINLLAICINVFVPWTVFSMIFALLSFSVHYYNPVLVWAAVVFAFASCFVCYGLARRNEQRDRDPMWYKFTCLSLFIATAVSSICGDVNFRYNMAPYYDINNLNYYPAVNPADDNGQHVMDAGRINFADGTALDMTKGMSFRATELYCVVPIVNGGNELASYDFWGIGVNCCSGVSSDFRCGEFNNPHARSGLRLMDDGIRAFFMLAVKQAEAAYSIKADHPLFFYWMQDPVAEVNSYRHEGFKYFLLGIVTHFAFNLFCVICGVVAFSKIGRY